MHEVMSYSQRSASLRELLAKDKLFVWGKNKKQPPARQQQRPKSEKAQQEIRLDLY